MSAEMTRLKAMFSLDNLFEKRRLDKDAKEKASAREKAEGWKKLIQTGGKVIAFVTGVPVVDLLGKGFAEIYDAFEDSDKAYIDPSKYKLQRNNANLINRDLEDYDDARSQADMISLGTDLAMFYAQTGGFDKTADDMFLSPGDYFEQKQWKTYGRSKVPTPSSVYSGPDLPETPISVEEDFDWEDAGLTWEDNPYVPRESMMDGELTTGYSMDYPSESMEIIGPDPTAAGFIDPDLGQTLPEVLADMPKVDDIDVSTLEPLDPMSIPSEAILDTPSQLQVDSVDVGLAQINSFWDETSVEKYGKAVADLNMNEHIDLMHTIAYDKKLNPEGWDNWSAYGNRNFRDALNMLQVQGEDKFIETYNVPKNILKKIKRKFGKDWRTAAALISAESSWDVNATNYNEVFDSQFNIGI